MWRAIQPVTSLVLDLVEPSAAAPSRRRGGELLSEAQGQRHDEVVSFLRGAAGADDEALKRKALPCVSHRGGAQLCLQHGPPLYFLSGFARLFARLLLCGVRLAAGRLKHHALAPCVALGVSA
ncbi:hypothetical protein TcBrA4_0049170 [Trypanosoma cruzi]|nr:hypothetical protein TcBrA4_0049170 [Trypanosoma cruzi]